MDCEKIKFRLKTGTMLLPKRGIQTVYFVAEDKGLVLDVLAVTHDNKYEYFDDVKREYFVLHPQYDLHIEKEIDTSNHY